METPPLTRGRRTFTYGKGFEIGNTPAYAGKTLEDFRCTVGEGKHPRLRGEDSGWLLSKAKACETPPLTRGRPERRPTIFISNGNTPAYAGKTVLLISLQQVRKKHPRLRGEDATGDIHAGSISETPPLTRGRLTYAPEFLPKDGKHPRLRGEDIHSSSFFTFPPETPPLTRGRREVPPITLLDVRNTPAYAGKTKGTR